MQQALTALFNIKPEQAVPLRTLLLEIGGDIRRNRYLRFPEFRTIHFARFVMLDHNTRLLFTTTYDGDISTHLQEFLDCAPEAVHLIFGRCEGFPDVNSPNYVAQFKSWVQKHSLKESAFFQAYPSRSVGEVCDAITLHKELEQALNTPESGQLLSHLGSITTPPVKKDNVILKLLFAPIGWLLGKIVPLLLYILGPHMSNARTVAPSHKVNVPYELTEREAIVQNELTIIAPIRPERLNSLKNILGIVALGTKLPSDGTLSGVSTIHFARWVIYDEGKTLLFESNYDGAWESYIGEFIDRAASGLDAIWGCCVGYPERGAKDAQEFKRTIIEHQYRAEVFYSAYPRDSVKNILNDLSIYDETKKLFSRTDTADFLRRL
jgi:hypothetical protein